MAGGRGPNGWLQCPGCMVCKSRYPSRLPSLSAPVLCSRCRWPAASPERTHCGAWAPDVPSGRTTTHTASPLHLHLPCMVVPVCPCESVALVGARSLGLQSSACQSSCLRELIQRGEAAHTTRDHRRANHSRHISLTPCSPDAATHGQATPDTAHTPGLERSDSRLAHAAVRAALEWLA